jgi:hypothetical protein
LLICANNDSVLSFADEDISVRDLQAITERFFHVQVQPGAADWLRNVGQAKTREFVEGGAIARHALYLAQTVPLPDERFVVTSEETSMHRNIVMTGDLNGLIFEWLTRFASTPERIEGEFRSAHKQPGAVIGNGQILVNSQTVVDFWKTYMNDVVKPKTGRVTRAISSLSYGSRKLGPRGARVRYHRIDPSLVIEWSHRHQIGDTSLIMSNLERDVEISDDAAADDELQLKLKKYMH